MSLRNYFMGFALTFVCLFGTLAGAASAQTISIPATQVSVPVPDFGTVDRVLTLAESAVQQVSVLVTKLVPEYWDIHVRQVEVMAATIWIAPLILTIVSLLCFLVLLKIGYVYLGKAKMDRDWEKRQVHEYVYFLAFVAGAISLIVLLTALGMFCSQSIESYKMSNNPKYYAISKIVEELN